MSADEITRLARRFGVMEPRPVQRQVIQAVLAGDDVLAVMPTGAGKSLCYQIPALSIPGSTVIVSPLLALMQDQQEKLAENRFVSAGLNSTLSAREEREAVEDITAGEHEFIYVTPEQLERPDRIEALRRSRVSLFVVDEAHCISQWGHDFRPAYLGLADAIEAIGRPRILALTATAPPSVRDDILHQLRMPRARVFSTGIARDNLFLDVRRSVNDDAKRAAVLDVIERSPGAGIIYSATVRAADELHGWLRAQGLPAARYHGKLRTSERETSQRAFMDGDQPIMVATKAFGMGIDKPDIRFVVHYHFPDSLESYSQEVGRAGRDGELARATLLYRLEDRRIHAFFLGGRYPKRDDAWRLYEAVLRLGGGGAGRAVPAARLAEAAGLPPSRVKVLTAYLAGAGAVERGTRGIRPLRALDADELDAYLTAYEEKRRDDRARLDAMKRYAERAACRWRTLGEYFGEETAEQCGHCDVCVLDEQQLVSGAIASLGQLA